MSERNLFGRLRDAAAEIMGRTPTTYLTSLPAPTDGDYPLRKRQEDRLYRALCRRGAAIMLYGPGGMGKTHMARSLFYRMSRKYKRLAWVEYGADLRTALTPVPREGVTENPDVRFARFIEELREAPQDTILFIDDAKEWAAEDPVLAQITGMGVTVFLTSRCPRIASYEGWALEPVTVSECVELFYANYRGDRERKYRDTVEELVRRLDRNVFAVLLLARVTGEGEKLPRIAQRLTGGDLMDHIGQLIECSRLTAEQQQLLRCLALTNSGELLENLVDWMDFRYSDVQALVRGGWLDRYIKSEIRILNERLACLVLHDLVREYYNRETPDCQTVERFIKGALGEDFCRVAKANTSSDFKGNVLDFQLRALAIMEQHWDSQEELAVASNNVGLALFKYGEYRRALECLNKALSIRELVLPPDHPDLAISYNNVGTTYGNLGDREKELEYYRKALTIRERSLPRNHPDIASSCNYIALTYAEARQYAEALQWVRRALEIAEHSLPEDHPDRRDYRVGVEYLEGRCAKD